ncbi:MAG: putative rane protein [Gemmatimonadetes bacterium]|nr:putative rane protein [Gemmatimonadota bacterium]
MSAAVRRTVTILLVLGVAAVAGGQTPPPIARYVPPAPNAAHVFVLDSAHLLSPETVAALQDSARALQSATGTDVAWVTLPTLGGRPIEEAALYIGRTWRIGTAGQPGDPLRNRGLVILYVPDKTKTAGPNFRIEVGNGLEGTITDARSRTITAAMRNGLKAKQYDAAYLAGWAVAAALVREDFASHGTAATAATPVAPVQAPAVKKADGSDAVVGALFVVMVVIFLAVVIAVRRRAARSPTMMFTRAHDDEEDERRRRPPFWMSGLGGGTDSSSGGGDGGGSGGSSGGGDFGGGGGFSGGGSSDTI